MMFQSKLSFETVFILVFPGISHYFQLMPKFAWRYLSAGISQGGKRYFFPYPFLDLEFFYLFLYFTLKIYQNLLFFQMRRRIEPQTNNHKSNYRTTRQARDELPDLRF